MLKRNQEKSFAKILLTEITLNWYLQTFAFKDRKQKRKWYSNQESNKFSLMKFSGR